MSVRKNPWKAIPEVLNRLTETIGDYNGTSSTDDINKIRKEINSLKKRFLEFKKMEKQLFLQVEILESCHHEIERSNYSSVLAELRRTNELLRKVTVESDDVSTDDPSPGSRTREGQNSSKLSSPLQEKIMEDLENNKISKSLRASYYDFVEPVEVRICLLILAIFPENAVLTRRLVIYWWIGEGLVTDEKQGEEVFVKLLQLGLIMRHPVDRRPTSTVNKFRIHPWIRYMLLLVAKKEKILHLDGQGIPQFSPWNWRTIFNVSWNLLTAESIWLEYNFKFVVLQLGRWQVDRFHDIKFEDLSLLQGLRTQKHLKYLSLRGISRITTLPDCIKGLVSLEILDLKACHNLETLPDTVITSLGKLTHLDVSECYLLESIPKGLHKITSLRALQGFIIGHSHKSSFPIRHLQKLKNLERLSVYIGRSAVILKNEFDTLKELKGLKCLKISWGTRTDPKVVSFPPSLEKLNLEGFPYRYMPEWLNPGKLSQLKKLYIKGGHLSKLEGTWNNVEILILKYTNCLKIDEQQLLRLFPSLQYVKKVHRKEGYHETETLDQDSIEFEWSSLNPNA